MYLNSQNIIIGKISVLTQVKNVELIKKTRCILTGSTALQLACGSGRHTVVDRLIKVGIFNRFYSLTDSKWL